MSLQDIQVKRYKQLCLLRIAVDVVLLRVSVPTPAKQHSLQWEDNEERR